MKLQQILERLKEPIPASKMSSKVLKGNRIDFVSWVDLIDLLNERAGIADWDWEIKTIFEAGNLKTKHYSYQDQDLGKIDIEESSGKVLTVVGKLTIHGEDKSLSREATGLEELNCSSYGDPSSNAEAMALRRCCAKFGLGLDLWRKDSKPTSNGRGKGELTKEQWLAKRAGN
jgi:hypothetical protein